MYPSHGVSWTDGADPSWGGRLSSPAQGRLHLLFSHWLGHLHPTCRSALHHHTHIRTHTHIYTRVCVISEEPASSQSCPVVYPVCDTTLVYFTCGGGNYTLTCLDRMLQLCPSCQKTVATSRTDYCCRWTLTVGARLLAAVLYLDFLSISVLKTVFTQCCFCGNLKCGMFVVVPSAACSRVKDFCCAQRSEQCRPWPRATIESHVVWFHKVKASIYCSKRMSRCVHGELRV